MCKRLCASMALGVFVWLAPATQVTAQATPTRRLLGVFDEATGRPVVGAEVLDVSTGTKALTSESGAISLAWLEPGATVLHVRKIGYTGRMLTVVVSPADTVSITVLLKAIVQALPAVTTRGAAVAPKLAGFVDRRRQGVGHFIDREELARHEHYSTGMILATVAGVSVRHGANMSWAVSTRAVSSDKCAFCRSNIRDLLDRADIEAGARPACYMDVYLDGALVYQYGPTPPMALFNLESIPPAQIEGIEIYTSASQMPAQFNRTSGAGCGAMVIWTR